VKAEWYNLRPRLLRQRSQAVVRVHPPPSVSSLNLLDRSIEMILTEDAEATLRPVLHLLIRRR
jgi:hypothetical protein